MKYKLIAGRSNMELAEKVAEILQKKLTPADLKNHNDGEIYCRINGSVRGSHVFVIQSTSFPANDNLMELIIMVDALKRASAKKITAVIPYLCYARQDRISAPRESLTAKLVADMIVLSGVDQVIAFDLHTPQIQLGFNIPVDELSAIPIMAKYILEKNIDNMVVVSPDGGGKKRAEKLANAISASTSTIDKERTSHGKSKVMGISGKVKGKVAFLVDDMIDTGETIVNAVKALKKRGAKDVYICATHGVLSKKAKENLNCKEIKEVILTDSIQIPKEKLNANITILSIAPYIAASIKCATKGNSMNKVLNGYYSQLKK